MADMILLLNALGQGDPQAAERLWPLVYLELRRLAAARPEQIAPPLWQIAPVFACPACQGQTIRGLIAEVAFDPWSVENWLLSDDPGAAPEGLFQGFRLAGACLSCGAVAVPASSEEG